MCRGLGKAVYVGLVFEDGPRGQWGLLGPCVGCRTVKNVTNSISEHHPHLSNLQVFRLLLLRAYPPICTNLKFASHPQVPLLQPNFDCRLGS